MVNPTTRSSTPPASGRLGQPTPVNATILQAYADDGFPSIAFTNQLAINLLTHTLAYYDSDGSWQGVPGAADRQSFYSPISPDTGSLDPGDRWFNTTTGRWNVWTGTAWLTADAAYSADAPVSPAIGQAWFNTTLNEMRYWDGSSWVLATDPTAPGVYTGTIPSAANAGSVWTDPDDVQWYCITTYSSSPTLDYWTALVLVPNNPSPGFTLDGPIMVGDIVIDPAAGILIPFSGGYILFPADGSDAQFINVQIDATSLLVYDNFELRGLLNRIAGLLELQKGIVAPPPPTITTSDWTDPSIARSLTTSTGYPPTQGSLNEAGSTWVVVDSNRQKIISLDKTTGGSETTLLTLTGGKTVVGFAQIGTTWYVLTNDIFASSPTTQYAVTAYSAAWSPTGVSWVVPSVSSSNVPVALAGDPTTGLLYVMFVSSADYKSVVRSIATSGVGGFTTVMTTPTALAGAAALWPEPFVMYVGNADFGAQRFVLGTGSALYVYSAASGGTRLNANEWTRPGGENQAAVWYDGANFRTLSRVSNKIWKLSPVVTAATRSAVATQYDSVVTRHETAFSTASAIVQPPRTWVKVGTGAPGGSGGTDEPNRMRVYIQTIASSASYFLQPDITASPWVAWYGVPATGTATGPTDADFSGVANPGSIASAAQDSFPSANTPLAYIKGSGEARLHDLVLPHLSVTTPLRQSNADMTTQSNTAVLVRWTGSISADATGEITNPNTALNSDGRIVLGTSGLYEINAVFTFASSTAGTTRRMNLLLNAGATIIGADSRIPNGAQGTSLEINLKRRFTAGDYFTTEVLQVAGTTLGLFGAAEGYAHLSITRIGR